MWILMPTPDPFLLEYDRAIADTQPPSAPFEVILPARCDWHFMCEENQDVIMWMRHRMRRAGR